MIIHDIDRPDVNGVPPTMQAICTRAHQVVTGPPCLQIWTNDNLMSSICVKGSFDSHETWEYGIWENSRCFAFLITPAKGKRYYTHGETVSVEMSRGNRIRAFRKYTGTPEKVLQQIAKWIQLGM